MLALSVSEQATFRNRKGNVFKASPVVVELGRYVRGDRNSRTANVAEWKKQTSTLFPGDEANPNDLLHAMAALYDTCLPDVPLQSIYRLLVAEGCRTIFLLRDTTEILEEWETSAAKRENSMSGEINNNPLAGNAVKWMSFQEAILAKDYLTGNQTTDKTSDGHEECTDEQTEHPATVNAKNDSITEPEEDTGANQIYPKIETWKNWHGRLKEEDPIRPLFGMNTSSVGEQKSDIESHADTPFSDVFSDSEENSESLSEMEEEEDQEDFTRGMEAFCQAAVNRKRDRKIATDRCSLQPNHVGIEHRLMACASFQKNYRIPGTKVVHVSLLAVRKRFRKSGVGRFLVKKLKSPQLVGPYDALAVQADKSSFQFFLKSGFTDDIILNSRFRELDEIRDSSKPMCYLPPFDGHYPPLLGLHEWSSPEALSAMDDEIERWRSKSLEAYQAQVTCMTRLHQEVLRLHCLIKKQEATIHFLRKENQRLQIRLSKAEKRSTKALLDSLEKEANEFERLCSFRIGSPRNHPTADDQS